MYAIFFIKRKAPSIELSRGIINICQKNGFNRGAINSLPNVSLFNNNSYKSEDYNNVSWDEIITLIGGCCGSIDLLNPNIISDISVTICQDGQKYKYNMNHFGYVELTINDSYLNPPDEMIDDDWKAFHPESYDCFLKLLKDIIEYLNPIFGYMYYSEDFYPDDYFPTDEDLLNYEARYLYQMNYYSIPFVEKIGKDRLLSAPVFKVEELKTGGIFLLREINPLYYNEEEKVEAEVHLGFRKDIDIGLYHQYLQQFTMELKKDVLGFAKKAGIDEDTIKKAENMEEGLELLKGMLDKEIKKSALELAKIKDEKITLLGA